LVTKAKTILYLNQSVLSISAAADGTGFCGGIKEPLVNESPKTPPTASANQSRDPRVGTKYWWISSLNP
jgi:hypothetical protein